ncbi:MAG: HAD family hydrolase [Ruminococcaceae bacterium]|nr:HAD family hydrolase [Oscillospiraceae bacterium]
MIVNTSYATDTDIVNAIKDRKIVCAFHDIDGTHSLIRNWPPVMSRVLYDTAMNGIPDNLTSEDNINRLVELCDTEPLEETDRFCIESAGLSALTQMEWAIRRNQECINGKYNSEVNSKIIELIWAGKEKFDDFDEPKEYIEYLADVTPKLFWVYEQVLNRFCRDKNLAKAKENPNEFLIPGSKEFMNYLYQNGVKNFFVTGAVVDKSQQPPMGMYEEVLGLGFDIGENKVVEDIFGSTWEEKIPKDEVMIRLVEKLNISGENVLVIGDGRSEISAGVKLGAVTVSILPKSAKRQRELHKELGTNMIIENYKSEDLLKIFSK